MAQGILRFFMDAPGDRKRREAEHKSELGLIDARESSALKAKKDLMDKARSDARFEANAARHAQQEKLAYALMEEQGLSEPEAMLAASHQLAKIETKPDLERMTSAMMSIAEKEGAMPIAGKVGEAEAQARFGAAQDSQSKSFFDRAKRAATGTSAVLTSLAEDTSAQDRAALESTIARKRLGTAAPAAVAQDVAQKAIAETVGDRAIREKRNAPDEEYLKELQLNHDISLEQSRDVASEIAARNAQRQAEMTTSAVRTRYPFAGQGDPYTGTVPGVGPAFTPEALGLRLGTSAVPAPRPKSGRRTLGSLYD